MTVVSDFMAYRVLTQVWHLFYLTYERSISKKAERRQLKMKERCSPKGWRDEQGTGCTAEGGCLGSGSRTHSGSPC